MDLIDLDFAFPDRAVATTPRRPTRVAWSSPGQGPRELTIDELVRQFRDGDLLVVNDTRVIPARVKTSGGLEILFVRQIEARAWEVLCPARALGLGAAFELPGGVGATLESKGLPQTIRLDRDVDAVYFATYGRFALPPYIQKARGAVDYLAEDATWYQTEWARVPGSVAAPTASLHFGRAHLAAIAARGARIETLTLHVGPGTFLPVRGSTLDDHVMHGERVEIPRAVIEALESTRRAGDRVWALGTTVTRALESHAQGLLVEDADGARGETKLFIRPPYTFRAVDVLLTNFHQPRSTLLALVAAFADLGRVRETYTWAIENEFKLFSYGDLSAWTR